ncbi:hypothetical protein [Streptomyces thermolilacinus]|uniref:Uncharacterized protein n=1 Tax=Streptomyces thermolilacinus SPC6 TaxID=1306406 RepID=A0A1D3DY71_9ACTN|nr:hypothetical protein [Streptomyces thermolilacinus]OEJ97272.1 hypothetical protein J116_025275 [Streptomyces thermolilacinus SPC6]
MTTDRHHLETVDLLRARPFPRQRGRSDVGESGPGYHIAELATSEDFWEDRGRTEEVEEQYEAERDALGLLLAERWGEPQIFSLWSVFERGMNREEMPEPWGVLSSHVPDVHLWRADGRWIALGVSQWDRELPFQLLAVVTETDPP